MVESTLRKGCAVSQTGNHCPGPSTALMPELHIIYDLHHFCFNAG